MSGIPSYKFRFVMSHFAMVFAALTSAYRFLRTSSCFFNVSKMPQSLPDVTALVKSLANTHLLLFPHLLQLTIHLLVAISTLVSVHSLVAIPSLVAIHSFVTVDNSLTCCNSITCYNSFICGLLLFTLNK